VSGFSRTVVDAACGAESTPQGTCWTGAPVRHRGKTGSPPGFARPRSSVSCAAVPLRDGSGSAFFPRRPRGGPAFHTQLSSE